MGLTVRNLSALLNTTDDFELHIVDSNSNDNTWDYIRDLIDPRIKSKTHFDINRGQIYASNYVLSKRRKEQNFITVDSDVCIHTKDWISKFIQALDEFQDVGLLGAIPCEYLSKYKPLLIKHEQNDVSYLQLCKGFVEGCCQCFRPSVLNHLGYFSEENCMGDMEMTYRVLNYTPYRVGYVPSVEIDQLQAVTCNDCSGKEWCDLGKEKNCFVLRKEKYCNPQFGNFYKWKFEKSIEEMKSGKRTGFCASIHDELSLQNHYYNKHMADENFNYYIVNSN